MNRLIVLLFILKLYARMEPLWSVRIKRKQLDFFLYRYRFIANMT